VIVVVPVAIGALQEFNSRGTTVKASALGLAALSLRQEIFFVGVTWYIDYGSDLACAQIQ
jgi:hypothetical protein